MTPSAAADALLGDAAYFVSLGHEEMLAAAREGSRAGMFKRAGKSSVRIVYPPEPGRLPAEMAAAALFDDHLSPWADAVGRATLFETRSGGSLVSDSWAGVFLGWGEGGGGTITARCDGGDHVLHPGSWLAGTGRVELSTQGGGSVFILFLEGIGGEAP